MDGTNGGGQVQVIDKPESEIIGGAGKELSPVEKLKLTQVEYMQWLNQKRQACAQEIAPILGKYKCELRIEHRVEHFIVVHPQNPKCAEEVQAVLEKHQCGLVTEHTVVPISKQQPE